MKKPTITTIAFTFFAVAFGSICDAQFREQTNNSEPPKTESATPNQKPAAEEKPSSKTSYFTDLGNGTLKQNSTGLIWLANPTGIPRPKTMDEAKAWVAKLKSGQHGLNDGSTAGSWRLPTAAEMMWAKRSDRSSRQLMDKHFSANGQLRGYIGTAGGKFESARSVWGGGTPTLLEWQGQYSGSGEYIWPVSDGKSSQLSKTIPARTFIAIESTVVDDVGNSITSWELYEAASDFDVMLSSKEKQAVDNPMLKYCRDMVYEFNAPDGLKGQAKLGPRGSTVKGDGFNRTYGSVFLIDGKWVSEGRVKKYVFTGQTAIDIAKPVTFTYRHGISWSPN